MEKGMDMEKKIINMGMLNLQEIIYMEKNGMEKDLIHSIIWYMN